MLPRSSRQDLQKSGKYLPLERKCEIKLAEARAAIICLINRERIARGIGALKDDSILTKITQCHSEDMAVKRALLEHPEGDLHGRRNRRQRRLGLEGEAQLPILGAGQDQTHVGQASLTGATGAGRFGGMPWGQIMLHDHLRSAHRR